MWVIKIGGSLLGTPELALWLKLIAKHSDGKIIVVPGGGVFANAVRQAQTIGNFSQETAHNLAVHAMNQFATVLSELNPDLAIAQTEMEIDERTWQHRGILWMPARMVLTDDRIPQNWDVTSDSIAAWLAGRLNAQHLILLKSAKPEEAVLNGLELAKNGWVDQALPSYIKNQSFETWLLDKTQYAHFETGFTRENMQAAAIKII